ncbi:MAG: hypothetical protein ACYS5F_15245 [Planctomycetota bacterium]|jgi:hypothetical protein
MSKHDERDTLPEYAMVEAYEKYRTEQDAINAVKEIHSNLSINELHLMWRSIDAYCDMNHD